MQDHDYSKSFSTLFWVYLEPRRRLAILDISVDVVLCQYMRRWTQIRSFGIGGVSQTQDLVQKNHWLISDAFTPVIMSVVGGEMI